MPALMSFDEVIAHAQGNKLHVLLGNGFSRACRNDLFSYTALLDTAREQGLLNDSLLRAFDTLGTDDFEAVMRLFIRSEQLLNVYAPRACQRIE